MPVQWSGPPAAAALLAMRRPAKAEPEAKRCAPGSAFLFGGGYELLQGGRARRSSAFNSVVLVLLPWLMFVLVTYLFVFSYEDLPRVVGGVVAACTLLATVTALTGATMQRGGRLLALGAWSCISVALGAALGLSVHGDFLGPYWQIREGHMAEVPDPSEPYAPARGARAPTAFAFAAGAFVDDHRTVGVVAEGQVYCIAPVARVGVPSEDVAYWAVGVNCCQTRSGFDCGASRHLRELSGVSFRSPEDSRFQQAVSIAASVWGTRSGPAARFVYLVDDADAEQSAWWSEAMSVVLAAFMLHLAWTAFLGVAVERLDRPRTADGGAPAPEHIDEWEVQLDIGEEGTDSSGKSSWGHGTDPFMRGGAPKGGRRGGRKGDPPPEISTQDSIEGSVSPSFSFSEAQELSSHLAMRRAQELFEKNQVAPKFFNSVVIAHDGGFSEVEGYFGAMAWKSVLAALAVPALIVFNFTYLTITDLHFLLRPTEKVDEMYLLSTDVLIGPAFDRLSTLEGHPQHFHIRAQEMFAIFEITGMVYYLVSVVWLAARLPSYPAAKKWISVYELYWEKLPKLSTYSLMGYLGPVTPSVLLSDFEAEMSNLFLGGVITARDTGVLVRFVLKRLLFAIIGFDAFLVKFRLSARFIYTKQIGWWQVMGAASFVLQLLGIVKTSILLQRRLFTFMFAGEDCVLDPQDEIQMKTYNALLAQKIWNSTRNFFHFNVVMLSFDDFDFQKLVLNTHHDGSTSAGSIVGAPLPGETTPSEGLFGSWGWPWRAPAAPPTAGPPPAGPPAAGPP